MWSLGGHLGSSVSALVDGQMDAGAAERAWSHVLTCPSCRRLVEREGSLKTRLARMSGEEPPARLLGSLYGLHDPATRPSWDAFEAWVSVDEIERKGRTRRRVGLAAVGAGSVSAAVLGFTSLGGVGMGIGGTPAGTPATSFTRATVSATPGSPAPGNATTVGHQVHPPLARPTHRPVLNLTRR